MCTHISIWHLLCQIMPGPCRGGSFGKMKLAIRHQRLIGRLLRCRSNEVLKTWNHAKLPEWTSEPMNRWINERMNQWIISEWRTNEPFNPWINEPMKRWIAESMIQWIYESMIQGINESISRSKETMNQWTKAVKQRTDEIINEAMNFMNLWTNESVNHSITEPTSQWKHDSVIAWTSESRNEQMKGWMDEWTTSSLTYFFTEVPLLSAISSLTSFLSGLLLLWPAFAMNCLPL